MKPIPDDISREMLADIVGSQGWLVFQKHIVLAFVRYRMSDVLLWVQKGDAAKAQACLAAASSAAELLEAAYEGAGLPVPEEVRALRQPGFNSKESQDGMNAEGQGGHNLVNGSTA